MTLAEKIIDACEHEQVLNRVCLGCGAVFVVCRPCGGIAHMRPACPETRG